VDELGYFELHDGKVPDVNLRRKLPNFEPSINVLFGAIRAAIIVIDDHYSDCADCCLPVDDEFHDCDRDVEFIVYAIIHFVQSGSAP
jgi:hypothetical protein